MLLLPGGIILGRGSGMARPVVKALVTPAIQHTLNESIGIGLGIRYRPMTIFAVQN
jgi:hypothetical protein